MFVFYASARKVEVKKTDTLVSDSINVYPCKFQFSADWVGLTKTAVFRAGTQAIEVMLDENTECNIPWEVLLKDKLDLYVGCYGTKGEDIILNTTWTNIGKILEGTKNKAVLGEDPTPDIYTQLASQIGDLSELQTIDKSNLVNAINEVNTETLKNADNKIDKSGDTVTGPILFTDTSAIMAYVYEDEPIEPEAVEGVEISSEGIYKNSEGPLSLKTHSGVVDFHHEEQTSVLTGVMGDTELPDSVPNMFQVAELIDTVRDEMPTKLSELSNDVGFITRDDIPTGPSGPITEEIPTKVSQLVNDAGYITNADVPTKTSELVNDSGYITAEDVTVSGVASFNGRTGNVMPQAGDYTAAMVGALPDTTVVPTKTSQLENDSGFLTRNDIPDTPITGEVPTKVSQLQNDVGFITEDDIPPIPSKTSELTNDSNFATQQYVQDSISDIDIPSVPSYSAGKGITIQDSTISVTLPINYISQEEYDALSTEEKNAEVIYATPGNGQPADGACWEMYSEEERRIGTWIDGKPLYEVSGTFGPVNIGTFIIHEFIDSVKIIGIHGFMYTNTSQIPLNYNQTKFYSITYWANNQVKIETNNNLDGKLSGVYTIRYTKTTD